LADDPHTVVASGYDRIAGQYAAEVAASRTGDTYYRQFLDRCLGLIPEGGRVLDLGCGAGIVAADIARRARVIGVDISPIQISLALKNVPTASFVVADMTRLDFRPASFDALATFWSMIHVRRNLHAQLLRRMHMWLRPGAPLFGTFGSGDNPDERQEDFFGTPMYWSHYDAETNRHLISAAGFRLVQANVIEDQHEQHLWVIATA
jgi:ubiquinone/menaquinone biosynthesis C-methylase UbiE